MVLFLVPIVAGAAAYSAATQEEAGSYSSGDGSRSVDAYQIWEQITTGPGAGSIIDGQDSAGRLQRVYAGRVQQIEELSRLMDEAWQGDAADAASAGAHPLRQWMEDSGTKLRESDRYLGEQGSAFQTVHSKVQPIPRQPPESGFLNDITPWETDTDRAIRDYNTKAQANVDAFNEYYLASSDNASNLPVYNALDGQIGEVDIDDDGGGVRPPGKKPGDGDETGGGDRTGGDRTGGDDPGGSVRPGVRPGVRPDIGGLDRPPGGTPDDSIRLPEQGDNQRRTGYDPPDYTRPTWDDRTGTSGYDPGKVSTGDYSTGRYGPGGLNGIGSGGGSNSGSGGFGGVGGIGGFGPGGGGGGSYSGSGVGGAGASGAGSGSNPAPGATSGAGRAMGGAAMGGAAAAGAAGARGAAGMPMGGMGAGGGRGKGSDDEEHQSKYLIQEDGDSLFGSDELTAPPVIGE
ncbi:PPE domain-containing protein [Saccharomonospora sp. NPDC046836]|uniref:PPE domain-containing protein n=1 Tax=Saccharomonospora sp. NPDC046836 TaxID=3156921 RepID=UPI003400B907